MPNYSDIVSLQEASRHLNALMDKVWDDSAPAIITQDGGKHVVMMNKDDYDKMCGRIGA